MAEKDQSRVVFQRSKEHQFFSAAGISFYVASVVFMIWSLYFGYHWVYWSSAAAILILLMRWFSVSLRETYRKIVFLQDYIAFNSWIFLPNVYTAGEIVSVETVEINKGEWTIEPETYVKVIFSDGKILKVQKSLVSVRKFRKQLRKLTGKSFRKPAKKKKVKTE